MIKLRGIAWDHPRGRAPLEATAGLYARQHGVDVEWFARSLQAFGDAPIEALAEEYDVIIVDHPHVGVALADARPLLPLDEHLDRAVLATLEAQSAGPSHASYRLGDHQWGLALDGAMQTSVLRRDLLDIDAPRDWESALRLGADLRRSGVMLAMPLAACDAVCSFISICAGRGGMNEPDVRLVDPEIGAYGLELLVRLREIAHPRSVDWNPIQMLDQMSTREDVAYCPLSFCYTNYSRTGFRPHLLEFGPIPQRSGSILGGAGFAVSARCRHPAEACAYGAWLCSAEVQRGQYVEQGGCERRSKVGARGGRE